MTISVNIYLINNLVERENLLSMCSSLILVLASISFVILPLKESIAKTSKEDLFKYQILSKQWFIKEFPAIAPYLICILAIIIATFIFTSNKYTPNTNIDSYLSDLFIGLGFIAMNIEKIFDLKQKAINNLFQVLTIIFIIPRLFFFVIS